jgi:hypothetical protein
MEDQEGIVCEVSIQTTSAKDANKTEILMR